MGDDASLWRLTRDWMIASSRYEYSYHFTWLGRPIIQFPQDIIATQELIWKIKPDIIIETGIARGGSLMLSASILELLGGDGLVVGVDTDIRAHNRIEIEKHPLSRRIKLIEGSSIEKEVVAEVTRLADGKRGMVILDSNHTHEHVSRELDLYSPLISKDSYLIVFDTIIETFPEDSWGNRPWRRGNNPYTAVREFLAKNDRFAVDWEMENRLLITVAPGGYLRCIKE